MSLPSLFYRGRKHLPYPRGPYAVGCADIISSFSKSGAFVRLFYPVQEENVEEHYLEWPLFLPSKEYIRGAAIRMAVFPVLYEWLYPWLIGDVFIPSVWHGRIIQNSSPFPVIVFSHGLGGWRNSYSTLCLELVSHGFVVASVEHRDSSASASFYLKASRMSACGPYPSSYLEDLDGLLDKPVKSEWSDAVDGHWEPTQVPQNLGPLPYSKEWVFYQKVDSGEDEVPFRKKQLDERAEECSQALDMLESLNNGTFTMNLLDPNFRAEYFRGRLDMQKAAIVGHSFGGATTILSLANELGFRVGVALDPWMLPLKEDTDSFSRINRPLLAVCTDYFHDAESTERLKKLKTSTANECHVLKIRKSEHRDQSDLPFICGFLMQKLLKTSGLSEALRAHYLTSELTMDFLSKNLGLNLDYKKLDSKVKDDYVVNCF